MLLDLDNLSSATNHNGGAFYNPTAPAFGADYTGDYFFADLCGGWIHRFDPVSSAEADFATGLSSPVDLAVTDDGSLYYLQRGPGPGATGEVWRITRNATAVRVRSFRARRR